MKAGDCVFWHTDICHAVEVDHDGDQDASVAYIAAAPTTEETSDILRHN
jgi:hypothetical protein